MEFLLDPSIWAGLLTLVLLEIILGIDNLVFIAILADKLPPKQRDKARRVGLSLALLMRLALLSLISWIVTLTHPLFSIGIFSFSTRDIILLTGGIFLLFKATMELHERLENSPYQDSHSRNYASFWAVVTQIVVLDAVFSLDSVITAVGMVDHLLIMMIAVVIAMIIMLRASRPLTRFVNAHQTVVVLCLSFLLMIGLSLMAEGFGFHIPKGYLYAAIGFSILIELFNQIARRNFLRYQARRPMRERTAEAILRMIGSPHGRQPNPSEAEDKTEPGITLPKEVFKDEERYMINSVLTLATRSVRSIMTPRGEISWVDATLPVDKIRLQLLDTPHSLFPVCRGELDEIIGIVRAKELLVGIDHGMDVEAFAAQNPPMVIPETLDPINLMGMLRRAKGSFVIVADEFGVVQGLITPLDVLEAIAGEFPDEDEMPDVCADGDGWLVKGVTDLHSLDQRIDIHTLIDPDEDYASLAGLLINHHGQLPKVNDVIELGEFRFQIVEATDYQINLVKITRRSASEATE